MSSAEADWLTLEWMNDPGRIDSIKVVYSVHQTHVDLKSFADKMGIRWATDKSGQRIRLDLPVQPLIFTAGTPFVLAGDKLRQIPLSAILRHGDFIAPLEPLMSILVEYYPGEILYDPTVPKLLVSPPRHDLFGLRFEVQAGMTRALIPSGKLLECRTNRLDDGSVSLTFPAAKIDTAVFNNLPATGLIARVRASQEANSAVITLYPDSGGVYNWIEKETDPPLFCVEFIDENAGGLDQAALQRLESEKDAWALDVVVIDPGHGGKDPGAVGATKKYEKDFVLDIGLKLREALKKQGLKTVMTRDRDIFIPLSERTKIANSSGGKLFISLHCNSLGKGKKAYGVETYFLAPAKTEKAMRVALRENSVIQYEESRDQYKDLTEENLIILNMAQANWMRESEQLAGIVQQRISGEKLLNDRGVDQAGFYVLIGASMPSILVELGFISTKSEEKKLKDSKFRKKLAEQLAKATLRFLEQQR